MIVHVNKFTNVKHARNHQITSLWGIPLNDVRESINDENGSQDI